MKKILLVATFSVAGLVSAKDNKTEEKEKKEVKVEQKAPFQQCGVTITFYSGGRVTGVRNVYSDQPTLESCQAWQNNVRFALQIAGFYTI